MTRRVKTMVKTIRLPRRPSFPMLVPPRMALDDACSAAYAHPRMSRELALRAAQGAASAGDRTTHLAAIALANALELLDE